MGGKHTPGPWRAIGPIVVDGRDREICEIWQTVSRPSSDEAAANASLIAAAPDLLAALEHARARLVHTHGVNPNDALHSEIDVAIARATGGAR